MLNKQSVIIIGAGVGGLFCGAILCKEGYSVKIFEKHYVAGGGLHQFKREGVSFETGIHIVGGFNQGGVLQRICSYLDILNELSILPEDDDCIELFQVGCDGKKYKIPKGATNYIETLGQEFPEEKDNIARYIHDIYAICDNTKLYNLELEHAESSQLGHPDEYLVSVGDFINSYTSDERLRAVLALANPLYAGTQYETPVYIHALITKFFMEGACRFVDGSQQLADALIKRIRQSGGEIYTNNAITHIEIEKPGIDHIVSADGQKHRADYYISAIHPSSLFKLLDTAKLQRSYYSRIDSIPNTYSSFCLYIIFKPDSFPFFNYTGYYQDDYNVTWSHDKYTLDTWPQGIMYLTPPTTTHDTFAEKMIVNCIMNYNTVQKWEDTKTGNRGQEYIDFKKWCEQRIIMQLEKVFPNIRSCIKSIYSASPLTIRDFYNQKEGALYGVKKDCNNMERSYISVRTKLNNLLLTGQNVNLHGILGVPLTAISTCAELVGMEHLLNKINKY